MINIKRIRLDSQGLITQDQNGKMRRIFLDKEEIKSVKDDYKIGLKNLVKKYEKLRTFFTKNVLNARVDIADEETDCLSRPLRVYYGIEPRCNLACKFCGPRDFHNEFRPASKETENFLLQEITNAGTFQIQLTGGEIGIRGYNLLNIIEKTKKLGLAVILSTNGVWSCIDKKEEFLERLSSYDNIIQTKISIEGVPKFHESVRGKGTYRETIDTLSKLSKYHLHPRINTTIFKSSCNKENLEHLVVLAEKYSASLQPITLRPAGKATKLYEEVPTRKQLGEYTQHATELRKKTGITISFNFDIFNEGGQVPIYDLHRPISCPAGLWGLHITHMGEVYPCGFAIEIGKGKTFLAGTIMPKKSLLDIWLHGEVFKKIRYAGKAGECRSCSDYGKGCWGGCWADAYLSTGKLNGIDPHCLREYKAASRIKMGDERKSREGKR